MFITIEGGEGSGKTSLIKRVASWFEEKKIPFFLTREPGGTPVGEKLRSLFLDTVDSMSPMAELLILLAARAEHVETVVRPNLDAGKVVICDRYIDSTMAYQAYGRGLDPEYVWSLATAAVPLLPDLSLYLDVSLDVGFQRVQTRQDRLDRMEKEGRPFHERVRSGFLAMAKRYPQRIIVLDAGQTEEAVAAAALFAISKKFVCT